VKRVVKEEERRRSCERRRRRSTERGRNATRPRRGRDPPRDAPGVKSDAATRVRPVAARGKYEFLGETHHFPEFFTGNSHFHRVSLLIHGDALYIIQLSEFH